MNSMIHLPTSTGIRGIFAAVCFRIIFQDTLEIYSDERVNSVIVDGILPRWDEECCATVLHSIKKLREAL